MELELDLKRCPLLLKEKPNCSHLFLVVLRRNSREEEEEEEEEQLLHEDKE